MSSNNNNKSDNSNILSFVKVIPKKQPKSNSDIQYKSLDDSLGNFNAKKFLEEKLKIFESFDYLDNYQC